MVKKIKEHIKEKETGALSHLVTQFLNKHASVSSRHVIEEKLEHLRKKGGKSIAQALTYGEKDSLKTRKTQRHG